MITKLKKHNRCPVVVGPGKGPHYASLWCKKHNVKIQWLSEQETKLIKKLEK